MLTRCSFLLPSYSEWRTAPSGYRACPLYQRIARFPRLPNQVDGFRPRDRPRSPRHASIGCLDLCNAGSILCPDLCRTGGGTDGRRSVDGSSRGMRRVSYTEVMLPPGLALGQNVDRRTVIWSGIITRRPVSCMTADPHLISAAPMPSFE